jgi:hypothetical protein
MKAIDLIPPLLHRGTASLIIALSIFLAIAHVTMVTLTVQRTTPLPRARMFIPLLVGGYLAMWLALAFIVGDGEHFRVGTGTSRRNIALVAAFGPLVGAVGFLYWSKTMRALNAAMPPSWLIWVQSYRVAGAMFLYPFLAYGVLPAAFALPAGVGDIVTGALAPLVARSVANRRPNAARWAVAWNLFGILDLVVAVSAAIASQAGLINLYPLALVGLFLGPPLGVTTHLYSIRNLVLASRASAIESRPLSTGQHLPAS